MGVSVDSWYCRVHFGDEQILAATGEGIKMEWRHVFYILVMQLVLVF
jgi:hypothetical protein